MADWNGLAGRRVLITGATGGIGLAAAKALRTHGAHVAIVARSEERGRDAVELISRGAPAHAQPVDVLLADLSSLAHTRQVAQEALHRYPRIDVLVNNAGAVFGSRQLTAEGLERTWALNHLSPFVLTNALLPRLRESGPARVITTASDAHKGMRIPFDDLDAERSYRAGGFIRYGQSKLANILFTSELQRRLDGSGVSAYCHHPGVVATGFNRNNGPLMNAAMLVLKPFIRSPERGARTLLWLAEAQEPAPAGGYFVDCSVRPPGGAALDLDSARRLWEVSEARVQRVLGSDAEA
ncbi:MAG: SDR family oxidoreductase [Solirubrobacteraceae bacterium]